MALSITTEGTDVAKYLAAKVVTAFVLLKVANITRHTEERVSATLFYFYAYVFSCKAGYLVLSDLLFPS